MEDIKEETGKDAKETEQDSSRRFIQDMADEKERTERRR